MIQFVTKLSPVVSGHDTPLSSGHIDLPRKGCSYMGINPWNKDYYKDPH